MSGFLLILFSELGDKTFFLALLLALKENKSLVFAGTFGALAVMTVISVSHPLVESPAFPFCLASARWRCSDKEVSRSLYFIVQS